MLQFLLCLILLLFLVVTSLKLFNNKISKVISYNHPHVCGMLKISWSRNEEPTIWNDLKAAFLQVEQQLNITQQLQQQLQQSLAVSNQQMQQSLAVSNQQMLQSHQRLEKSLAESDEKTSKKLQSLAESDEKTSKKLQDLIGYNQNQDRCLELAMSQTLKQYLLDDLKIPDECILEFEQRKLYDPDSITEKVAVEWDAIYKIDYAYSVTNVSSDQLFSKYHNSIYLLEAKQNLPYNIADSVISRANKTAEVLSNQTVKTAIKRVILKLKVQQDYFNSDVKYNLVVAVGAKNLNNTLAVELNKAGLLAIVPSGNEFKVVG